MFKISLNMTKIVLETGITSETTNQVTNSSQGGWVLDP